MFNIDLTKKSRLRKPIFKNVPSKGLKSNTIKIRYMQMLNIGSTKKFASIVNILILPK